MPDAVEEEAGRIFDLAVLAAHNHLEENHPEWSFLAEHYDTLSAGIAAGVVGTMIVLKEEGYLDD